MAALIDVSAKKTGTLILLFTVLKMPATKILSPEGDNEVTLESKSIFHDLNSPLLARLNEAMNFLGIPFISEKLPATKIKGS